MKRVKRRAVVISLIALAVMAWQLAPSGPVVRGRFMSQWTSRLGSRDSKVREEAVEALADCGVEAIPFLIVALGDDDLFVNEIARRSLVALGPVVIPNAVAILDDSNSKRRDAAIALLADFKDKAEAALVEALMKSETPTFLATRHPSRTPTFLTTCMHLRQA